MSWYTYFKLREDSKYKDVTIDKCNRLTEKDDNVFTRDYKGELLASMVQAYYLNTITEKRNLIFPLLLSFVDQETNNDYHFLKRILEGKDGIFDVNKSKSEYEMKEIVEKWDGTLKKLLSDLLILSCIRFEPNDRYSDTPKDTMEYLEYSYVGRVKELLEYYEDEMYDYSLAKFLLENCDRIGDEGDGLLEELLNNINVKVENKEDEQKG